MRRKPAEDKTPFRSAVRAYLLGKGGFENPGDDFTSIMFVADMVPVFARVSVTNETTGELQILYSDGRKGQIIMPDPGDTRRDCLNALRKIIEKLTTKDADVLD